MRRLQNLKKISNLFLKSFSNIKPSGICSISRKTFFVLPIMACIYYIKAKRITFSHKVWTWTAISLEINMFIRNSGLKLKSVVVDDGGASSLELWKWPHLFKALATTSWKIVSNLGTQLLLPWQFDRFFFFSPQTNLCFFETRSPWPLNFMWYALRATALLHQS